MRRFPMILVNVHIQPLRIVRVLRTDKLLWVLGEVIGPVRADGCKNMSHGRDCQRVGV